MGYISRVTGELEIRRPENTKEKPEIPQELLQQLATYGATVQVSEQPIIGLRPSAIKQIDNDQEGYWIEDYDDNTIILQNSGKAYELEDDIRKLVTIANADGAELYGTILRVGEESGDVSRIIVNGTTSTKEEQAKVVLQWADGTTEPFNA